MNKLSKQNIITRFTNLPLMNKSYNSVRASMVASVKPATYEPWLVRLANSLSVNSTCGNTIFQFCLCHTNSGRVLCAIARQTFDFISMCKQVEVPTSKYTLQIGLGFAWLGHMVIITEYYSGNHLVCFVEIIQ